MPSEVLETTDRTHIPNSDAIEWHSSELGALRKELITSDELSLLTQRNNWRWISAVAIDLLIIVIAIALSELFANLFFYLFAVIVIAGRHRVYRLARWRSPVSRERPGTQSYPRLDHARSLNRTLYRNRHPNLSEGT